MTDPPAPDDTLSVEKEPDDPIDRETPFLFVAFRCDQPLARPHRYALRGLDEVLLGRGSGPPRVEGRRLHVALADARMSQAHARLTRSGKSLVLEDQGSKNGSLVNGIHREKVTLRDGDLIELGGVFLVYRVLADAEGGAAVALLGGETLLPELAAELTATREVARSSVPLLILGETGTGKEVVARAAHAESGRTGPLVPVNCAALPATLVESELFGHKKGAFSGAVVDRVGLIAAAHKGTLLLDEIGELPMAAQAALLRVLQDGEVTPLGATKSITCDVRVIGATNRELGTLVDAGRFRADLYARLAGFTLRLWPLRDRKADLGLLIASLLERLAPERARSISFALSAARMLFQHDWPLNIRELEKALAAALVLSPGRIERAHLQLAAAPPTGAPVADPLSPSSSPSPSPSDEQTLAPEHEERRRQIVALLERHDGNISAVAREMGKDRVQIRRWMRMYQIAAKR